MSQNGHTQFKNLAANAASVSDYFTTLRSKRLIIQKYNDRASITHAQLPHISSTFLHCIEKLI